MAVVKPSCSSCFIKLVVIFLLSGVTWSRKVHRREADNFLTVLPDGPQEKPVGQNLFLTCKAVVHNPELVRDLKWYGPGGRAIPEDDRVYTEELPGDPARALFVKEMREEDSGEYECHAIYANNEKLVAKVRITTFIDITWEDAPVEQYGVIGTDYKIRCVVRANPPATIDWLKESLIVATGDRYVIESDGLLIKNMRTEDAGTYTCRARVTQKGNMEERDIKLEVQIPPQWVTRPQPVTGIEQEKVEFQCEASGTPVPHYIWVDWEGRAVTDKEGWKVQKDTGHVIAYNLKREDAGEYTCIAENNAGRIEAANFLNVIIKPKVQELYNKTFPIGQPEGRLICKASGEPLPQIIWRKWSRNEPFVEGGQPDDERIFVENRIERAPDYTEGEEQWAVSELSIQNVQRKDDGLYECQARNKGGQYFKSGHIQVEFPPTFEEQPMFEQWSWHQNPVNLTCIATAIPNATITWWWREREIGREITDRNFKIIGKGPRSDLIVTPLELQYYGRYTCKAQNPHGEDSTEIELREARKPSFIQQAITDKVTATTIEFRFVGPTDTGGLPIESYAVEYKDTSQEWKNARRRIWPATPEGNYILENLLPQTTYDVRFAAKNLVGISEWGAGYQLTMPQRGPPEPVRINTFDEEVGDDGVLNITSPSSYELMWYLPEDNGAPIDYFEITFFPVSRRSLAEPWERVGNLFRTEVPHPGNVRYKLTDLWPNTHFLIQMRAHNNYGFSTESQLVIKTARDPNSSGNEGPTFPPLTRTSIPIGAVIGGIIIILLIGFVLVDLTCFKVNKTGVTYMVCQRARRKSKASRAQANIPGQRVVRPGINGHPERDPLIHSQKRDTVVSVATKNGQSAAVAISGQDSSV